MRIKVFSEIFIKNLRLLYDELTRLEQVARAYKMFLKSPTIFEFDGWCDG